MTLTKADIIRRIYESKVLSKADSTKSVETLLELMKQYLETGNDILISGFGKFIVKEKKARRGRNPHTGDDLILEPRRVVTFRPSGVLRRKLNAGKG
ncbi:MAG: integration host factor subunit alpha [Dissulfurimicrobium sp.]|uniref:integration host factor subunit alpha n=1 Tax=Dissulfurimicrobium TaxID=1769732 RepID=UPI001ED9F2F0|nr:integration host factor subunit alpha [Dissulfurimicrobium hydrothermale]UKL13985.1 integration host factor subunit alpha [Dissulfurimicrobium hydrothermale]